LEYFLTDVQKEIKKLTRDIAVEQVLPVRAKLGQGGGIPLGYH